MTTEDATRMAIAKFACIGLSVATLCYHLFIAFRSGHELAFYAMCSGVYWATAWIVPWGMLLGMEQLQAEVVRARTSPRIDAVPGTTEFADESPEDVLGREMVNVDPSELEFLEDGRDSAYGVEP